MAKPVYIGGDPSQGRYAMASDPGAPAEPPMSPKGKSYYSPGDDPREGDSDRKEPRKDRRRG